MPSDTENIIALLVKMLTTVASSAILRKYSSRAMTTAVSGRCTSVASSLTGTVLPMRTITTRSYDPVPKGDMGKYAEFSVIFTNRSLNLMSDPFQKIMCDLNGLLKDTYNADKVAILPG